jgi:hypothetical protein
VKPVRLSLPLPLFHLLSRVNAARASADALARLNEIANAVICFENDQMGDMVAPKAGIHQLLRRRIA